MAIRLLCDFRGSLKNPCSIDHKSYLTRIFLHNPRISHKILELLTLQNSSLRENERSEFSWQSTTNQSRDSATESRPIRGAKNRIQTSSSASADFLLESDKRGSPPKSEKRQLLARRGSGAGGAALLREKTSESKKQNSDSVANNAKTSIL